MPKPMILPIKEETFEDHFISRGWNSPQDQIDAGFPRFIQPTNATAEFEQVLDLGVVITQGTQIDITIAKEDVVAGIALECTISTSPDETTWTDYTNTFSAFASNFRYIKVHLDATGGGTAIMRINQIRVLAALRKISDSGRSQLLAADSPMTQVDFAIAFADVSAINISVEADPAYPDGISVFYNYNWGTTPADQFFQAFATANIDGSRIDAWISWTADGY